MEMLPEVGEYSPTMSFSRVDFPVPFAPISPVLSPGFICQLASSYKAREPISNVRLLIAIIFGRKDTGNPSISAAQYLIGCDFVPCRARAAEINQDLVRVTGLKVAAAKMKRSIARIWAFQHVFVIIKALPKGQGHMPLFRFGLVM